MNTALVTVVVVSFMVMAGWQRRDELGVPSVRVLVAWDVAEYVLERMRESGIDLGFKPLGLDALRLLGG